MRMDDDPRDVALRAVVEAAPVYVMLTNGEQFTCHIDRIVKGGVVFITRIPVGRMERPVHWDGIASMAVFEEDEDVEIPHDPLDDLTEQLKARAAEAREASLAERMVNERSSDGS